LCEFNADGRLGPQWKNNHSGDPERNMHMGTNQFSHLALSGDGFLFDASTCQKFNLNASGTFILKRMIQGLGRDQIITAMAEVYDAPEDLFHRDLSLFCQYLKALDIIQEAQWR
jgi:hypothetical protein